MTEENVEITEEPTESLVPKDRETSDAGVEPTAEASATEVLECEIVDEDEEASAEEAATDEEAPSEDAEEGEPEGCECIVPPVHVVACIGPVVTPLKSEAALGA